MIASWKPIVDDIEQGLALHYLLTLHTISLADGFIINNPAYVHTTIGHQEASLLVSAFDLLGRSEQWWNAQRSTEVSEERIEAEMQALLQRIRSDSRVVGVSP